MRKIAIAIDGPAGAGKSTMARACAKALGYLYVDTGAIYRTVGYYMRLMGIGPKDKDGIARLIDEVKAERIPVVFYLEMSDGRMADTVCEATGAKKRLFHSCHNVTAEEQQAGETYLSLMYRNRDAVKEALG